MSRVPAAMVAALALWPAVCLAEPPAAFDQRYQLYGIRYHVVCPNDVARPTVTVTPSKLAVDNSPVAQQIEGRVVGAAVADLDHDRSPEIYVFVKSAGPRAEAALVAYSANRRKSMSAISLPAVSDDPALAAGYRGRDELAIERGALVRRFPVYADGDPDGRPSGGTRRVRYALRPGEAGWVLRVVKVEQH